MQQVQESGALYKSVSLCEKRPKNFLSLDQSHLLYNCRTLVSEDLILKCVSDSSDWHDEAVDDKAVNSIYRVCMVKRFNTNVVHSPLTNLKERQVLPSKENMVVASVKRFEPKEPPKSGSKPSPKHHYHFATENNAQFLLKCVSNSSNCRTLFSIRRPNTKMVYPDLSSFYYRSPKHSNRQNHYSSGSRYVRSNF